MQTVQYVHDILVIEIKIKYAHSFIVHIILVYKSVTTDTEILSHVKYVISIYCEDKMLWFMNDIYI